MDWNSKATKKHIKEAEAVGLTLIGKGRNYTYRTYRFNACKHEQEIQTGCVRINNFRCNQCLEIKHEKEAKAVGLTLIGEGRNFSYKTYRFNDCKHQSEPGCAIRAAIDSGELSDERIDSYRKFQRELAHFAEKFNASLRSEKKNDRKKFAKMTRKRPTKRD